MEIAFYEDPACSWCWAFQPVATRFAFEFGPLLASRRVMGGLRDLPAADAKFVIRQWKKAEAVSGMPFDPRVWRKYRLRTTFVACRAVKAAGMISEIAAHRLLRRLREAQFVEQVPIDDVETIVFLGTEVGIAAHRLRENLASGRAETLFARDRAEAAQYGFGFPTIVLRDGPLEEPTVLQGTVPYRDLLRALSAHGFDVRRRRRFRDTEEHWAALFRIHPRLTFAELQKVTRLEGSRLQDRLADLGVRKRGVFYELPWQRAEDRNARPDLGPEAVADPYDRRGFPRTSRFLESGAVGGQH
ncbi:MAG: DsbA family protein, partial [Planctomycetota bacterium]